MHAMELINYASIFFKYPEMHTKGLRQPAANVN